jgi:hypothetical protein
VGRAPELKTLERRLAEAAAGDGGLLCIGGEAGVGKTRLAAELSAIATADDMTAAWATCNPDAPAFWPWRQLLRALGGANPVERLGDPAGATAPDRFVLFDHVAERLRAVASERPALLVFDDLQWADPPSLRLLAFAVRELRTAPVLVLGTYRDTDIDAAHALHEVVGELGSAASILRLGGLDVDAVGALLVDRLGDRGRGLADAVHARTGGNPFFIRELAHALEREPGEPVDAVPPAVVSLIDRELERCPAECRALLAAAAVAGSFDVTTLEAATGAPITMRVLDDAVDARLLRRDEQSYAFTHDIVRDAVLASLPSGRRAELHWVIGTALLTSPRRSEEAARHLEAGVAAGHVTTAVGAALAAARHAQAMFAFEHAVAHLEWVLGHHDAADADRIEHELMLGEALVRAGDWERGADTFERAAALARTSERPRELARAALGFGAGLGGFEVRIVDRRQIGLLEEASAALDADVSPLTSFVRARLSVALSFLDEAERRHALAREALDIAAHAGDSGAHAHALAAWCDTISGPEHSEERLAAASEILVLAREAANHELVLIGHRHRVLAFLELGDVTRAAREVGAFERATARYPLPIVTWYVPLWRGMLALLRGDLDAADAFTAEAEVIGTRAGSENSVLLVGTLRGWIAIMRGEADDALVAEMHAAVDPVLAEHPHLCSPRGPMLLFALVRGDEAEARHQLDAIAERGYGEPEDSERLSTIVAAAEGALVLGDRPRAAEMVALLTPFSGRFVVDGIGATFIGAVDEFLGALELLVGDDAAGRAHLDAALADYERLRAPLLAARARARTAPTPSAPATTGAGAPDHAELVREGAVWRATYAGRTVRVRDVKGVRDLALLLARPGEELHVSQLIGTDVANASNDDVVLDDRAKREYRRRIGELERDVADAEHDHDDERAARARAELDAFVTELTRAVGLGGRDRRAPDGRERARQAVRARIRWAVDRIAADHPALGRHLEASVRTGSFCSYRPEHPTDWDVRA